MESNPDHPFFVYGHGWASCDPDGSLNMFGLKCQRLQVGDVCISLTPRDSILANTPMSNYQHFHQQQPNQHQVSSIQHHHNNSNNNHNNFHHHQESLTQNHQPTTYYCPYTTTYSKDDSSSQIPQNLSRKQQPELQPSPQQTVPTTATVTAVTSRPAPHFIDSQHTIPVSIYSSYINSGSQQQQQNILLLGSVTGSEPEPFTKETSQNIHSIRGADELFAIKSHITDNSPVAANLTNNQQQQCRPLSNHAPSQCIPIYAIDGDNEHANTSTCSAEAKASNPSDDASLSRKRRWSAPDNICEDENCQKIGQKQCKH